MRVRPWKRCRLVSCGDILRLHCTFCRTRPPRNRTTTYDLSAIKPQFLTSSIKSRESSKASRCAARQSKLGAFLLALSCQHPRPHTVSLYRPTLDDRPVEQARRERALFLGGGTTAGSRRPILNSRGRGLPAFPLTQNSIQRDSTGRVAT